MKKILSFDIGGTKIAFALVFENGELASKTVKFSTPAATEAIVALLKKIISQHEDEVDAAGQPHRQKRDHRQRKARIARPADLRAQQDVEQAVRRVQDHAKRHRRRRRGDGHGHGVGRGAERHPAVLVGRQQARAKAHDQAAQRHHHHKLERHRQRTPERRVLEDAGIVAHAPEHLGHAVLVRQEQAQVDRARKRIVQKQPEDGQRGREEDIRLDGLPERLANAGRADADGFAIGHGGGYLLSAQKWGKTGRGRIFCKYTYEFWRL